MVGDKYTRLALLAGFLLLRLYSCPAILQDVGEVVYSLAENEMNISTGHCTKPGQAMKVTALNLFR